MDLRTLQRAFSAVLIDGAERAALEAEVRGDERASAAERVAVYAHMYEARLCEVLAEVYPRTRALVGQERFDALAADYCHAVPSRSPSLRGYGDRMDAFLAEADAMHAAAPSLARLEWARYEVFDALDQPVLRRERLATLGPDAIAALPLRAIAAARTIAASHDLDAIYRALTAGGPSPQLPPSPTTMLVWRDALTVYHRALPVREAEMLARLGEGLPLGLLCEQAAADQPIEQAAAEVFALVGRWVADGVLVDAAL